MLRLALAKVSETRRCFACLSAVFRPTGRCFACLSAVFRPTGRCCACLSAVFRPTGRCCACLSAVFRLARRCFACLSAVFRPTGRCFARLSAVFRPTGRCFARLSAKVSEAERFAGASPHTPSLTCDAAGAGGRRKKRAPYHLLCGRVCSSAGRQGVSVKNHKGEKPRLYDSLQTSSPCLGTSYRSPAVLRLALAKVTETRRCCAC